MEGLLSALSTPILSNEVGPAVSHLGSSSAVPTDTRGPDPSPSAILHPLSTDVPDAEISQAEYPIPPELNMPNYRAHTYNGFNFSLTTGFSPIHPLPTRPPSVDTLQSVSTLVRSSPPPVSAPSKSRISIGINMGRWKFDSSMINASNSKLL